METKRKLKWIQEWDCVGVLCKCEKQKPPNILNSPTGTCKEVAKKLDKSEFRTSNGGLQSFRKRHQIVFNEYSMFT
jgi:hypothetical protein